MPLRDHFHPPLSERRDWASFHARWSNAIADSLNELLPERYFADPLTHAGSSVEIDVATFDDPTNSREYSNGRPFSATDEGETAVATMPRLYSPPQADFSAAFAIADDFEIRIFRDLGGAKLVAAIELVSPFNKDRPESRRAFAPKCASYLHNSIAVIVVDIVTERSANLHDEVMPLFTSDDITQMGSGSLSSVAYRPLVQGAEARVEWWPRSFDLGDCLPTLPLWLNAVLAVPADLEATYNLALKRARIA